MDSRDKAWHASAEALKQNILAYAAGMLGLDPKLERLVEDSKKPFCIRIDPGIGQSFPLIDVPIEAARKRSPGANITVMVRALKLLTFARIWRDRGTKAPPVGLLNTTRLTKLVIDHYGVNPQDFVDATWVPVPIFEKYDDWAEWQSDKPFPTLLSRDPISKRQKRNGLPSSLPWVSGFSKHNRVVIDSVALAEDAVLKMHVISNRPLELRLPPGMPATMVEAIKGRKLAKTIAHPLLRSPRARIQEVNVHARSTRITIRDPSMEWDSVAMRGGNAERSEFRQRMEGLKPQRDQLEAMIRMSLTVPGEPTKPVDEDYPMASVIERLERLCREEDRDPPNTVELTEEELPGFSREHANAAMDAVIREWFDRKLQHDPKLSPDDADLLSDEDWVVPSVLRRP
jgi:hypothetical protein